MAPVKRRSAEAGQGLELVALTDQARAFEDLSVTVPSGSVTALMGVEGSGAREMIRACGGLRRVHGQLLIDGRAVQPGRIRDLVSYVAADRAAGLFSNLSVGENLVIRLDSEISARSPVLPSSPQPHARDRRGAAHRVSKSRRRTSTWASVR